MEHLAHVDRHRGVDRLLLEQLQPVGRAQQVLGHRVRLAADDLHRHQHHLDAVGLRLLHRLGEVVVAGDQEHHVDGVVAGVGDQVEADLEVDPLLLPGVAEPPEPQLDPGQQPDLLLHPVGGAAASAAGVVPVDPQHREPGALHGLGHDRLDQLGVVHLHPAAQRGAGDPRRGAGQQVSDIDVHGAVGAHGVTSVGRAGRTGCSRCYRSSSGRAGSQAVPSRWSRRRRAIALSGCH